MERYVNENCFEGKDEIGEIRLDLIFNWKQSNYQFVLSFDRVEIPTIGHA